MDGRRTILSPPVEKVSYVISYLDKLSWNPGPLGPLIAWDKILIIMTPNRRGSPRALKSEELALGQTKLGRLPHPELERWKGLWMDSIMDAFAFKNWQSLRKPNREDLQSI